MFHMSKNAVSASKFAKKIESDSITYNDIIKEDYVYAVICKKMDDPRLLESPDENLFKYRWKLRGRSHATVQLVTDINNSYGFYGYVYAVTAKNTDKFEQEMLLGCIRNEYYFNKYYMIAVRQEKEREKNEHFDSLFSFF